jgi:molybdate transport system ATP-binding protein
MLALTVEKQLGKFSLSVSFETSSRVTALFGSSGAGKTTVINMIAGLVTPDRGRIMFDNRLLFDSEGRVNVPPHRRQFGYVFQDGRLFPHLTVTGNIDYGRRMHGLKRDGSYLDRIIKLLELRYLLDRRPGNLSGGERQRVAIARALMMYPKLLLLDEPLASLDAARKAEILPYLEKLRDETGVPMVYVSHHAAEVRRLATAVVRIEAGRVIATGGLELLDTADADAVS